MRRETQNLILLLIGGAVLKISLNGTYTRYVKPALGPWIAVAGAAAAILAAVLIARTFSERPDDKGGGEDGDGHKHTTGISWLLMVPALVLLFAPPPVLTVDQRPAEAQTALAHSNAESPVPPDGRLGLLDFVGRTLNAPETLAGREVTLVGFVRVLPDGLYLARVFIWCCVADARAAVVRLDAGPGRWALEDKQWARVVGTYTQGSVGEDPDNVPTVRVTGLDTIPEPQDPYEH